MYVITHSRPGDQWPLCDNLRAADVAELAAQGVTPLEALDDGLLLSNPCYTVTDDKGVLAMFGVVPSEYTPVVGAVWFLSSDRFFKHYSMRFLRDTKPILDYLNKIYPILTNQVSARNHVHMRWLQWAGATISKSHMVNGTPFHEFTRTHSGE